MRKRFLDYIKQNKEDIKKGGNILGACYTTMSLTTFSLIYMGLKKGFINSSGGFSVKK